MARLWLSAATDAIFRAEARKRRLVETGGPLFGYTDDGTGDTVVVVAYGPGPAARHRPRSFRPDRDATRAAIREVHKQSSGALAYIGDWHTHPGGSARPSGWDLRALATIASEPPVELPEPIAVIVPTLVLRRRVRVRDPAAFKWVPDLRTVQHLDVSLSADANLGAWAAPPT
jgi:integrative and conjugative element protein (TIGR02256 family)